MAALKMVANPDLAKVHKSGDLKYWPSFWMKVRDRDPFRKGSKGEKGVVTIGMKTPAANKKLVAEMAKCTTGREVIQYLNSHNAEMPVVGGGKVKITDLWKDNVKEVKPKSTTKIGGRDTELYSEILVQFCLYLI